MLNNFELLHNTGISFLGNKISKHIKHIKHIKGNV